MSWGVDHPGGIKFVIYNTYPGLLNPGSETYTGVVVLVRHEYNVAVDSKYYIMFPSSINELLNEHYYINQSENVT